MKEKVWSSSWLGLWFFRCWGGVWFLVTFIMLGSWNLVADQRALLEDHVAVPALITDIRIQEDARGSDRACLDLQALLVNPRGMRFRYCLSAWEVEDQRVGDQMMFLVSPDGSEIGRGPAEAFAQRIQGNVFLQPIVRLLCLGLSIFMLWRFVPALFARTGEEVWVKVRDAKDLDGSLFGASRYLRVLWEDPVDVLQGRTRDLRYRPHMPSPGQLRKRKGLLMYRAPVTGRLWWEAELPGFAGELTRFPGDKKAGWVSPK